MPAIARPYASGVETSKHMQVPCWHCGCWDHYECVDNQYLSPYRTGGKWLPWFLRKLRPFVFRYRPLVPAYFNIWGIFSIAGIFLITWYNINLMQFASLTLNCIRYPALPLVHNGGFQWNSPQRKPLSHRNVLIIFTPYVYTLITTTFQEKKYNMFVAFQNGGQITDWHFASFRFRPKFEKALSQRNFSSWNIGSNKEIMPTLTLLK